MRHLSTILVAAVAVGCADAASVPEAIQLTNRTATAIAYVAVEQELAARVDPAPQLTGQTVRDRAVRAGETVVADDIMGYLPGRGVVFFLYRITGTLGDPGVMADFATTVTVTGDVLRRSRGRVEITNLGP
jgi:hypothetical protein